MRRLLLIRHAKAVSSDEYSDDHDRPLSTRGESNAVTMARYLSERDEALDVIYSSTAARALEYANTISEFSLTTLIPDLSFYTFSADELLEILRSLPNDAKRVAVVAHNPAILEVGNRLRQADAGQEIVKLPTAGILAFNCSIDDWQDLGHLACEMDYFMSPKMC